MQRNMMFLASCAWFTLACASAQAAGKGTPSADYVPAFSIEEAEGDIARITLKQSAIQRLGLKTSKVASKSGVYSRSIGGTIMVANGAGEGSDVNVHVAVPRTSHTEAPDAADVVVLSYVGGQIQKLTASRDDSFAASMGDRARSHAFYKLQSGAGLWKDGAGVLTEFASSKAEREHLVVPYSSLLYDKGGRTWVYVDDGGAYKRHRVDVAFIEGDEVFLRDGPSAGSQVVSVGAVELLGIENEVGF